MWKEAETQYHAVLVKEAKHHMTEAQVEVKHAAVVIMVELLANLDLVVENGPSLSLSMMREQMFT